MSDNKIILREKQVSLIEELTHTYELSGMQPAMAKILALLTVSDEVELTFEQIQATLELSKSGTSQALNQLLSTRRIEYKTKLGDRKRYFHSRMFDWNEQIMEMFAGVIIHIDLNKRILAERTSKTPEFNKRMEEMIDFMSLMHSQTMELIKKYQENKV